MAKVVQHFGDAGGQGIERHPFETKKIAESRGQRLALPCGEKQAEQACSERRRQESSTEKPCQRRRRSFEPRIRSQQGNTEKQVVVKQLLPQRLLARLTAAP